MKVQPPLLWPCMLALVLASSSFAAHDPRQILGPPVVTTTSQTAASTTEPTETTQTPPTATTSGTPTVIPTTATTTPTTASQTPPTTSGTTDVPSTSPASPPSSSVVAPPLSSLAVTTTNAEGDAITITVDNSASETASSTALPTSTTKPNDDGGGLSTGSIVGMSVAAGVAVIGIIGFFVWKFTRKRFSEFDDNEAIKWPELNTHSGNPETHPLPTRETGRAGFDTGSETDLSRVNSTSNYSTPDLGAGGPDPYAVPPLPHLNPNQPYRDDPSTSTGYYDPYRGPVPGTIENGAGDWQPEAYPMTQLGGPTGRASPAPDYLYDGGRQSPAHGTMYGRSSPGPQAAYGGRASPGPQVAYGGRASPGPNAAYGGRPSPGPQGAYSTGRVSPGRVSPGPNTAYDAFGAR